MYSSLKLRTAQMMIFSLVAMIGLEKCCITSACLQWLCHSGERTVAREPLVFFSALKFCMVMTIPYTILIPAHWLSGRASALKRIGGCGFDPQPGHTKDFKNGTSCSRLARSIKKVELELVSSVSV